MISRFREAGVQGQRLPINPRETAGPGRDGMEDLFNIRITPGHKLPNVQTAAGPEVRQAHIKDA